MTWLKEIEEKLKPKPGNCYQDTIQALIVGRYDTETARCVLCHGFPRLTKACGPYPIGTLYGHAWLERDGPGEPVCIDLYTGIPVERGLFYAVGQVDPDLVRRYTQDEAWEQMKLHRHNGPWHEVPTGAAFAKK